MNGSKIYLLLCIVVLSVFLRFQHLNWDQGFHLHPDERAIVLYTLPLSFPHSFAEFLNQNSPWNPHFFAYGSFPLYFLKTVGILFSAIDSVYSDYSHINLFGRFLSALADIGTLMVLFFIGKKIWNWTIGLISIFFYGISVLPIQLSHFYAVDTFLTFFIMLTLYRLLLFYENPSLKNALRIGIAFGFSLATKVSAVVLLSSIGTAIAVDFALLILRKPLPRHWFGHIPQFFKRLIKDGLLICLSSVVVFAIFEPYAFLDFNNFFGQTLQQNRMTHDAFTFPYTLQYVGKIPYLYELKNIFFFGLGPLLAIVAFIGTGVVTIGVFRKIKKTADQKLLILLTFFFVYFIVVGKFAIGFMRYMLPLYPLFCLFGAVFVYKLNSYFSKKLNRNVLALCSLLFALCILLWPLAFLNIYSHPNTRVLTSDWINRNIEPGSTIAIEHWDDSLPLYGAQNYKIETLELYNPDTDYKWQKINAQLLQTQYIILASNRLYVPLQKLTDCNRLPPNFCYNQTAQYYKKLFSGELGFKKVAEFSSYPKLEIGNWKLEINDSSADESFTVYDHPKTLIFKKVY